jgi:flagellar motor switch protein FliN
MSDSPKANDGSDLDFADMGLGDDPFGEGAKGGGGDPFDFGGGDSAPAPRPKVPPSAPKPPPPPRGGAKPSGKAPPPPSAAREVGGVQAAAGLAADTPVQVVAVMGKKTITVGDLISLKKGEVLELNRFPNEAIDLVANGKLIAKGELVEIDGKLGVRIIKIFE